MIDLSVIIVSFNSAELLGNCLKSVTIGLKDKKISGEVIVVDNNSDDGRDDVIAKFKVQSSKFKVKTIENSENVGFGRANNQGSKKAGGRYLLFLNPDTQVKSGALKKIVEFMDENPAAGIASCRLVNPDGSFQPQGGYLPRLSTVAVWALFLDDLPILREILPSYQMRSIRVSRWLSRWRNLFVRRQPLVPTTSGLGLASDGSSLTRKFVNFACRPSAKFQIGWVGGTAMAVRRQAWEQLKGFDEKIFMYGEDVEICYRANKLGWKVMINPEAEIMHVGKASGGRWVAGEVKGLLYIFKKHKPGWEMPALKAILAAGMGLRWLIFGILGGNEKLRRAYAEAFRVVR